MQEGRWLVGARKEGSGEVNRGRNGNRKCERITGLVAGTGTYIFDAG
jgi:hypothetical protein